MLAAIKARAKVKEEEKDCDSEVCLEAINLYGCGNNNYGRLAQDFGHDQHLSTFTQCKINAIPHPNTQFIKIACGAGHVLAVSSSNQIYSWGKCHFGQLGHGQEDLDRYLPRRIEALKDKKVKEISAQDSSSYAVTKEGELYSWGCGFYGALGNGSESTLSIPTIVHFEENKKILNVIGGKHHTLVLSG